MPERDHRTPSTVYVAVGSNIDPEKNIFLALEKLTLQTPVQAVSTVYRTQPLGNPNQPVFFNGVWRLCTSVAPRQFKFEILRAIEGELGRVRTADRYAPRPIDLDLIVYGDLVCNETDMTIPDPEIFTRAFLAVPLLELAPDFVVPGSGEKLSALGVAHAKDGMVELPAYTKTLRDRLNTNL